MQTIEQFYWGAPSADLFDGVDGFELDETEVSRDLAEAVLSADADNVPALTVLAELYTRTGEYERGLDLDVRLTRLAPGNPLVWYNAGCSYSLLGDTLQSLESLRTALSLGYRDLDYMQKDPDLEAVRRHPGFQELIVAFGRQARS